jgi:hypothetical protein
MNIRTIPLNELAAWASAEPSAQAAASLPNWYDPPADPEELALRERCKEFHRKAVACNAATVRAREAGCYRAALRAVAQWESLLPLKNRASVKRYMRKMRFFYIDDHLGL